MIGPAGRNVFRPGLHTLTLVSDLESKTRYDPSEVEPRIVEKWLASGLFHPQPEGTAAENYSIAIPPPNVTGSLHISHALNNTLPAILRRSERIRWRAPGSPGSATKAGQRLSNTRLWMLRRIIGSERQAPGIVSCA